MSICSILKSAFGPILLVVLAACSGGGSGGSSSQSTSTPPDRGPRIEIVLDHPILLRTPGPVAGADVLLLDASESDGVDLEATSLDLNDARELYSSSGDARAAWSALSSAEKMLQVGGVSLPLAGIDPNRYYLAVASGGSYFDVQNGYLISEFDRNVAAYVLGEYLLTGVYVSNYTHECAQQVANSVDLPAISSVLDNILDRCAREFISRDVNNDGEITYLDLLKTDPNELETFLPIENTVNSLSLAKQDPRDTDSVTFSADKKVSFVVDNLSYPGKNYATPHNGSRITAIEKGYPTWLTVENDQFKVGDWVLLHNLGDWHRFDGAVKQIVQVNGQQVALDLDSSFHPDYSGNGSIHWLGPIEVSMLDDGNRFNISKGNLDLIENTGWAGVMKAGDSYKSISIYRAGENQIHMGVGSSRPDSSSVSIYARHRQPLGQHYSPWGNMAYAHRVGQVIESYCSGAYAKGVSIEIDNSSQILARSGWSVATNSTFLDTSHVRNQHNPSFGSIHSTQRDMVRFISSNENEGVRYDIPQVEIDRTFRLSVGVYSALSAAIDFQGSFQFYTGESDRPVFSKSFGLESTAIEFNVGASETAHLVVTQADSISVNRETRISDLLWNPLNEFPPTNPQCSMSSGRILLLGDSWFEASDYPGFKVALTEFLEKASLQYQVVDKLIVGQRLIKTGEAGTTVKKGAAWIDRLMQVLQPSFVVINYFTNDANSINGTNLGTFIGPEGSRFSMNVESPTDYKAALNSIISIVSNHGAIPIVLAPDVTASSSQTIRHLSLDAAIRH
ncbi:MAG: hypothetical protein MI867_25125 [Pseudomonadales bacterium]|nr:hypothetical protein [Pseudomonadales bacterium]